MVLDVFPAFFRTVERSFCYAKWILTDVTKSTSPIYLEAMVFFEIYRMLRNLKAMTHAVEIDVNSPYQYDDGSFLDKSLSSSQK